MARPQSQGGNRGKKGKSRKQSMPQESQPAQETPVGKVGSDPHAASEVGGKGDFGVHQSDTVERAYTSANTKASDPGAAQAHSGEGDGVRVSGAGRSASGPGSSSGGDIDTDIIGVGTGSGLAQSGPDPRPGPDDSDGTSREFASGPPAKGEYGPKAGKIEGTTHDRTGGDIETTAEGRGASAVSRREETEDDSFVGEISEGEASGQDNA